MTLVIHAGRRARGPMASAVVCNGPLQLKTFNGWNATHAQRRAYRWCVRRWNPTLTTISTRTLETR
jgi:hypothetical protein